MNVGQIMFSAINTMDRPLSAVVMNLIKSTHAL